MIVNKIGLEAEYVIKDDKGKLVIPPGYFDRDDFPLLGEIRGDAGKNVAETVSNFFGQKLKILSEVAKKHTVVFSPAERCPLALYRKVNAQIKTDKGAEETKVLNIYGTDIKDYTSQIVKNGKIQGLKVSCGLHIHFSSEETNQVEVEDEQYEHINIPVGFKTLSNNTKEGDVAQVLGQNFISLYKKKGYKVKKTLVCRASRLNKPAVEYIVKKMDDEFFERFAPAKEDRTKYRMPGYFELKPYGFEYRSLAMSEQTDQALLEIAQFAHKLLVEINEI